MNYPGINVPNKFCGFAGAHRAAIRMTARGPSAPTAQRYRIRRRIFDTLLKRRIFHRFGTSQFSGMISVCFFWGKNAGRILKLLVREIELSGHVETGL